MKTMIAILFLLMGFVHAQTVLNWQDVDLPLEVQSALTTSPLNIDFISTPNGLFLTYKNTNDNLILYKYDATIFKEVMQIDRLSIGYQGGSRSIFLLNNNLFFKGDSGFVQVKTNSLLRKDFSFPYSISATSGLIHLKDELTLKASGWIWSKENNEFVQYPFAPLSGNTYTFFSGSFPYNCEVWREYACPPFSPHNPCTSSSEYLSPDGTQAVARRDSVNIKIHPNLLFMYKNGLLRSTDKRKTWHKVLDIPTGNFKISKDSTKFYIFNSDKFYESYDNGLTWQTFNSPFSTNYVPSLFYEGHKDKILCVSNDCATVLNNGSVVNRFTLNPPLLSNTQNTVNYYIHNKEIYASIYSYNNLTNERFRTIKKAPFSTLVNTESEINKPIELNLEIFPNPLSYQTKASFSIDSSKIVTLTLYNILGQEIRTILKEQKEAGQYELPIELQSLPQGTYFIRLNVGNNTITKPITIIN